MDKVGVFFGSSTGNTHHAAELIAKALGAGAELHDVAESTVESLAGYRNLVIGTSTWGVGDLQDDMEGFASKLRNANLSGKRVALFGMGDQSSYGDTYCDGMGHLHEALAGTGCERVGMGVSTDGYEHDASIAVENGTFVGLALDEDNQSDLTESRISKWVEGLKKSFF